MPEVRLIFMILAVTALFTFASIAILSLAKRRSLLWILPPLLLICLSVAFFVKAQWFSREFEDIGYILMALVAFISGIITFLLSELVILYKRNKRDKSLPR